MKKFLAAGALAVAVLTGSVAVAAFTPIGSAAAQTAQSTVSNLRGHRQHPRLEKAIEVVADAVGVSPEDLVSELRDGKTITEVARDHGADPAAVAQTLVDAIDARIDKAVENGHLAEDTAAAMKGHVPERVDTLMNRTFGGGRGGS